MIQLETIKYIHSKEHNTFWKKYKRDFKAAFGRILHATKKE
jgi:hypothetical protein